MSGPTEGRNVNAAEALVWQARAQLSIRLLWAARHTCDGARERVHHWVRVLRMIQGHHYRSHAPDLTNVQIGAAIERLLDRKAKGD